MTSTTIPLEIRPILPETLRRLRDQGHDDRGHPWEVRVDGEGGAPLRCCLRDSRPGEEIVLISYAPVRATVGATGPGPYDETGPIFVHADECDGYADDGGYPRGWVDRPQTLRAYDANGRIAGGIQLEPGDDRDAAARELLTDQDVAFLHSRNIVYGCYMLEIRRA